MNDMIMNDAETKFSSSYSVANSPVLHKHMNNEDDDMARLVAFSIVYECASPLVCKPDNANSLAVREKQQS